MTYIDHYEARAAKGRGGDFERVCTHSWAEFTAKRLAWLYPDQDRSTQQQADLAAWNRLGAGKEAA